MEKRHDEALIEILKAEGKLLPFLDVVFGFLYRCTDFYHVFDRPQSVGFPPGVAEKLVLSAFRKWQSFHQRDMVAALEEEEVVTSPPAGEVTVSTSREEPRLPAVPKPTATSPGTSSDSPTASRKRVSRKSPKVPPASKPVKQSPKTPKKSVAGTVSTQASATASDSHNGAVRDSYAWSQTISDLTVRVPLPETVRRAREMRVTIASESVEVRVADSDQPIMAGRLQRKIQAVESTWTMLPGECIQLSLEKARECWWTALLEGEPDIDLSAIEAVKPWEDLSEEERMKVGELRAREVDKLRSVKTSGKQEMDRLLREAWEAEGSPFAGTPYDPSAVDLLPSVGQKTN